jgi:hypothetical protein
MWKDALFHHIDLHRLGSQIVENAPVNDLASGSGEVLDVSSVIPERLMSFLCHFFEARWWSYAWMRFALPEGFAAVLAAGEQGIESLQFLRTLWDAATFAETIANTAHASAAGVVNLRQEIYWLDWPVVQWILRLMAHFLWAPHATVINVLLTLFLRLGDSLCIEETHRIGRSMEKRDQQADVLDLEFPCRAHDRQDAVSETWSPTYLPIGRGGIHSERRLQTACPLESGLLH